MTPALLWELDKTRLDMLELQALPTDKLAWIYSNKNRDPGETDSNGAVKRPSAPFMELDLFRTYYRKRSKSSPAAGDDNRDAALMGAATNTARWKSWAEGKAKAQQKGR